MNVADEIIGRFNAVFGEPRTDNPDLFLQEFARCMDGYDENALRKAADRLIAKNTFWPKPAELLGEVRTILADQRRFRSPERGSWEFRHAEREPFTPVQRSQEEIDRANELVANFKKFLAEHTTVSDREKVEPDWKNGQRPGFAKMQRESPNKGLHTTTEGLSALSKRMMGDRE